MRIESAERTEEDLPFHSEHVPEADDLGDLFELIAEACSRISAETV
jgi:hypothetical protein